MDLATFGTSYAAGYGEGIDLGRGKGLDFSNSYPQLLANLLNVETLYNFSMPALPVYLLKDDIIEFVSLYKEKHGSTENLFITFELMAPHYMSYSTVRSLNGRLLRPAVAFGHGHWQQVKNGHLLKWYFSEKWNFKKILDIGDLGDEIDPAFQYYKKTYEGKHIVPDDYDKIKTITKARLVEEHFYQSVCVETLSQIDEIITCLNDHNVRYLGAWSGAFATARTDKFMFYEKTFQEINPELYKKCFGPLNFIKAPFTISSFLHSDKEYENWCGHLSRKGAVAMSDYWFRWIMNNQLLDYKNLDQLGCFK